MAPAADSPPDSNGSTASPFWRHVSRVTDRSDDLLPFVLVPVLTSLLDLESVRRALDQPASSVSLHLELALPTPLLDLWQFVDPPEPATGGTSELPGGAPFDGGTTPGSPTGSGGVEYTIETPVETLELPLGALDAAMGAWIVLLLIAYAAVASVLAAVYIGGIDGRLRGERISLLACLSRYAPRFFLYNVVVFGAFLALLPLVVIAPPLLLLAFPAVIVLGYLFYAAPFLLVVADAPVLEAFRRSYRLAVAGGPYLGFALWHVGVAAGSSIVLSLLVSAGPGGFLIALALAAPLSFLLTAATVSFLQAHGDRGGHEQARRSPPSHAGTGTESDDRYGWIDD